MIMASIETWLPIPGYEGYYEASNLGRVRSLDRIDVAGRRLRGKAMRQTGHGRVSVNGSSYRMLTLCRDGKVWKASVHRLVLLAFRGEPAEGQMVRHLNGVNDDNRLTNLKWGTGTENNLDTVRHGTNRDSAKTHCPSGHAYTGENLFFNRRGNRLCRACSRIRSRAQRAARLAELNTNPAPTDDGPSDAEWDLINAGDPS